MRLIAGFFSLGFLLAAPAAAQTPMAPAAPDLAEARPLAANYELANADGSRKCPITLDTRRAGRAFALAFNRAQCAPIFGFLGEVSAWMPGIAGAILLVNQNGRTIAEFTEGVGGVYEAIREGDAVYFLANLQFVDPSARPQVTDLFGDWNLSRPGGAPICRITLSDTAVGEQIFAVRVQPGCDAAVARFGPVTWRLDRDDMLLLSERGEALRFGRQEGGGWAKVPDRPRPLLMSKP